MEYRGQYNIKDLRSDSGALGWAHATESAGQYLQDIIPSVCEAKIRGTSRHTSSEDKTDPKKVVTTSFYDREGRKIATCHAHGDGTWSIAFQKGGQAELRKRDPSASGSVDDRPERKVAVLESVDSAGLVIHHGEMIHKPRACRGVVAENNDEVHRAHRTSDYAAGRSTPRQALVMPTHRSIHCGTEGQGGTALLPNTNRDHNTGSESKKGTKSKMDRLPRAEPLPRLPNGRGANLLDAEEQDLAAELARADLRAKEQRVLFSRLKALPWGQQERILEQSKALKA